MARVEKITVTVEMADGNSFTMVIHEPPPSGDNPHFVTAQAANGIDRLAEQLGAVLRVRYGQQRGA